MSDTQVQEWLALETDEGPIQVPAIRVRAMRDGVVEWQECADWRDGQCHTRLAGRAPTNDRERGTVHVPRNRIPIRQGEEALVPAFLEFELWQVHCQNPDCTRKRYCRNREHERSWQVVGGTAWSWLQKIGRSPDCEPQIAGALVAHLARAAIAEGRPVPAHVPPVTLNADEQFAQRVREARAARNGGAA